VLKVFRNIFVVCFVVFVLAAFCGCTSQDSYSPELKSAQLNTPTISEDGKLKVGVNASKSPLAGSGNDSIIGIDVDIAAAIATDLGLELEIIDVQSDYASALNAGTIDVALGVDATDSSTGFWMSDTYLPSCAALFTLESSTLDAPTTTSSIRAAAQVSSKSAWAVTNLFGDSTLVSRADLSSALDALSSGTTDYLAADAVIGMYAANRAGVDVKLVAMLDSESGYCAAILSTNSDLKNAISSTLSKLSSNGTIGVIETKWLGSVIDLTSVKNLSSTSSSSSTSSLTSASSDDSESSTTSSVSIELSSEDDGETESTVSTD
jgi:polar amino acid transport system substrate-binding protein